MKVCFFAHYSITNQDGATLSMYNIIEEMVNRGIEVSVILSNTRNISEELLDSKVKFIKIPLYGMRMDIKVKNILTEPKFFLKSLRNKFSKNQIIQQLKADKPDVIHINGLDSGIGAEIAQELNIPYVWHIRQFMEADLGKKLFHEKYVYKLVSQADSVIAISKDVKKKFEPIFNRTLEVVYNGVPIEKYVIENVKKFNDKKIKMLLAGRISPQKGQIEAIKAVEILRKRNIRNVSLTLVGQSETQEYLNSLKNYINTHNLNSCINIIEHTDDLRELRSKHDIGLTCSKKEAFGRVTVENMLANMFVIGADTGGTSEIIDDKHNGMLYTMGSSASLAKCVEYAINNREDVLDMIIRGHNDAIKKYSIQRVVDDVLKIYYRIIKKKK